MRGMHRQRGITLISMIIVLVVLGFFAFIGMKLFPIYSEYYAVVRVMKSVQTTPGVAQMQPDQIWRMLDDKFYVGYVTSVKRQHISLTRKGGYILRIAYEVRSPLLFNLDIVAKFDKSVDLRGSPVG